jgi:hypothetical protein
MSGPGESGRLDMHDQIEYRGFWIIYPKMRIVGTIHPYQISIKSNDPRLKDMLKEKFGKNIPIVCETQDLQDGIEATKRIIDEMLD